MGNTQGISSNSYGSIKLDYDSSICIADQELKGTVSIKIKKPYPFKSAVVEIKGEEVTCLNDDKTVSDIISDYIPLELPNVQNIVQPGTYNLPFYYKLPDTYPPSFTQCTIDNISGLIQYYCTAKLEGEGLETIQFKKDLRFAHAPKPTDHLVLTQRREIKGWFGSGKGVADVEVVIPKTELYSGEKLTINVNMDNTNCAMKIKRVKCKLYEETIISNQKMDFRDKARVKKKVLKNYLPGVNANEKTSYVDTISIPEKYDVRTLETVNSHFIKRVYTLMLVPVFDIIGGDKKMSLEATLTLSSLSPEHQLNVVSPLEPPYKIPYQPTIPTNIPLQQIPMPIQPQPPMMDPQMIPSMPPMAQPVPQVIYPPPPKGFPVNIDYPPIPINMPDPQYAEHNQPPVNFAPPNYYDGAQKPIEQTNLYPTLDPYVGMPVNPNEKGQAAFPPM